MEWTNVWERVSLCEIFLESTRFCVCVCVTIFIFHNLKFWSEYVIFLAFLSPPFSFPLNFYARPVGLLWLIYLQLRSMLGKWRKRSFFPSGWLFFSEQFSPHFEFEIGACNGQSIFLCCLHDLLDSFILAWIPSHWLFVLCVHSCIATYFVCSYKCIMICSCIVLCCRCHCDCNKISKMNWIDYGVDQIELAHSCDFTSSSFTATNTTANAADAIAITIITRVVT